jgi:hypothetical protein
MDILTAISKLPDLWFADKLRDRIASDQKKAAN